MRRIAIQGHPTRGNEVIKTLKSLGGENIRGFFGNSNNYYYFINKYKVIDRILRYNSLDGYRCYTLEKFEKEFPFKIGDKVIYDYAPYIGTVVDIKLDDNIPYRVNINGTICTCGTKMLKPYKEMNTRNITLTLDKAKEWYRQGGDLKEVALQAFTEQELNPLPRDWNEFCKIHPTIQAKYIFASDCPQKYIALWKLERLRDCYRQGWKPNWANGQVDKYCIVMSGNKLEITTLSAFATFLAFQSREVAEEFLQNFQPLIKEAGDLI